MNKNAKLSLVFALIALAILIAGILSIVISAHSFTESAQGSVDVEEPGGAIAGLFAMIFVGGVIIVLTVIILVFTSFFVYIFAYLAHKRAEMAISELADCDNRLALPTALRNFSVIEMTLAALAAISALLIVAAFFILI